MSANRLLGARWLAAWRTSTSKVPMPLPPAASAQCATQLQKPLIETIIENSSSLSRADSGETSVTSCVLLMQPNYRATAARVTLPQASPAGGCARGDRGRNEPCFGHGSYGCA